MSDNVNEIRPSQLISATRTLDRGRGAMAMKEVSSGWVYRSSERGALGALEEG